MKSFLSESEKKPNSHTLARHFVAWIVWASWSRDISSITSKQEPMHHNNRSKISRIGFFGLWSETFHLKAVSIQYDRTFFSLLDPFVILQGGSS